MFIRRVVLALLVMSCSAGLAQAEWVKVMDGSGAGGYTIYFETTSLGIDKKRGLVKVRLLYDFKTAQTNHKGPYLSIRVQQQYDCKEERSRILESSHFDGNMANGKSVSTDTTEEPWKPVAPGTIGETLWKMACPDGKS